MSPRRLHFTHQIPQLWGQQWCCQARPNPQGHFERRRCVVIENNPNAANEFQISFTIQDKYSFLSLLRFIRWSSISGGPGHLWSFSRPTRMKSWQIVHGGMFEENRSNFMLLSHHRRGQPLNREERHVNITRFKANPKYCCHESNRWPEASWRTCAASWLTVETAAECAATAK